MKTIVIIGGMSWESTADYYRLINQQVRDRLGGRNSAKILMSSLNFHEVEQWQKEGRWDLAADEISRAARALQTAGAHFLVLCTNTMHRIAPDIEKNVTIPLLHIADVTAEEIKKHNLQRVGLLGTRFTMEEDFYRRRIHDQFGIEVLIPGDADRTVVHQVIYEELCLGKILPASRQHYLRIIDELADRGAQGFIL